MVTLVLGKSGSGKTSWLIEKANQEKKSGNGNIAFIDTDNSHIYSLDHGVRLINAKDYNIKNTDQFYGFLAGIISRDYDLEKIYVDGIYDILDVHFHLPEMLKALNDLSVAQNVDVAVGLDITGDEIPQSADVEIIELNAE